MTENTKTASFFSLPAELRNRIYELALVPAGGVFPTIDFGGKPSLALLAIPPIRREAEPMYWRQNSFCFNFDDQDVLNNAPEASAWMVAVGRNISSLGYLVITCRNRFELVLCHTEMNGKPALMVSHLSMTENWLNTYFGPPANDHISHITSSINYALRQLFADPDNLGVDLAAYYAHNLVGGLSQFLFHVQQKSTREFDPVTANAMQFITGCTKYCQKGSAGASVDLVSERSAEIVRRSMESMSVDRVLGEDVDMSSLTLGRI
ncbi:hypothetical protein LTR56_007485 [Elasticomyces elasticus]|nr:hypothetical protein LTR56_007485 [Elasticomyces elasticus]KAK3668193.1 hypothetical protein LTR22_000878 [Elasticomyces elasticus]KAK4921361.1 hypothetical protein LTR49_011191 [Elasticomyces elasticus]KAK5769480.1 hypothetical protein LTS12_000407 [Elasticomyces elasticus]